MPPLTSLLQVGETLEHETFSLGETVSDVREIITRFTGRHERSPFVTKILRPVQKRE